MAEKCIGLITANYSTKHPGILEKTRPVASLPYGGRYRVMDFALSNIVNCGIRTVGLVMPYNYRSLIDHVTSGKDWMLDRKNGGLYVLPGSAFGTSRTGSRFLVRDLIQNRAFIERSTAKYIILSAANMVYNMDLNEVVKNHEETGADITILTTQAMGNSDDVIGVNLGDDGRVYGINHGVRYGDVEFLDCFVLSREMLLQLLKWYEAIDYLDLFEALSNDYNRVNVRTYGFFGYHAEIFNETNYFQRSMDFLRPEVTQELFDAHRPIFTKAHDTAPAKYESGCYVRNSIVSAGCRVWGSVADSIIGRNVIIESGATVRNAIIHQSCVIKSGARVENAIIDRNNVMAAGTEFRGTPENVLVKEKGKR